MGLFCKIFMVYERHMGKVVIVTVGERKDSKPYVGRVVKITPSTLRLKPYLTPHEVEESFITYDCMSTFFRCLNPEAAKEHVPTPRVYAERILKNMRKQINISLDDIVSVKTFPSS